jgi:hypothetical protein
MKNLLTKVQQWPSWRLQQAGYSVASPKLPGTKVATRSTTPLLSSSLSTIKLNIPSSRTTVMLFLVNQMVLDSVLVVIYVYIAKLANRMVDMSVLIIITTCQKPLTRIIPYLMTVNNFLKQLKSKFTRSPDANKNNCTAVWWLRVVKNLSLCFIHDL